MKGNEKSITLPIRIHQIHIADMLKYLIIPLSDDAASFCHYERKTIVGNMIPIDTLRNAIFWAMKENLTVQFLYPDREIPEEYKQEIDSIYHAKIVNAKCCDEKLVQEADILVFDGWTGTDEELFTSGKTYVIRTAKEDLFRNEARLKRILEKADRLVAVITDVDKFTDEDFDRYQTLLNSLIPAIVEGYSKGHAMQFNLLTDRMLLSSMNNCNAGWESITFAPDGKFYVCPAFYLDGSESVGDLATGLEIKNPQLYRIDHAPICRICDAYQCRRCIWINRNTTLEVNTPSHEQCVMAHIERNASKKLLDSIRKLGEFLPGKSIKTIDYIDPFETLNKK